MRITRIRAAVAIAATAACAAAGMAAFSSTATADPYLGSGYVAVGSDTIQYVEDAVATYLAKGGSGAPTLDSYDAFNPWLSTPSTPSVHDEIAPRGVGFMRPNGSTEGQAALSDAISGNPWPTSAANNTGVSLTGQVDIARSSGGPKVTGSNLTFVPFARDAVGVLVIDDAAHDLSDLTIAQLKSIYTGQITSVNGQTVTPYMPQAGSGTRSFYLSAIGVTDNGTTTGGTAVTADHIIEENGLPAGLTTGAIVPFSAAAYIAQNNGVAPDNIDSSYFGNANVHFANIGGVNPLSASSDTSPVAPPATPDSAYALNTAYYDATSGDAAKFGRDVYNVVDSNRIDSTKPQYDAGLAKLLSQSFTSAGAQSIIQAYGFEFESYDGVLSGSHVKTGGLLTPGVSGYPAVASATTIPFTSVPTPIITGNGAAGTIGGTLALGTTLTATEANATPAQDSFSYQWNANNVPIAGATASTLKVPASAVGKKITVTVTANKAYYTSMSETSAATGAVKPGTLVTKVPTIKGTLWSGKKLTVATGTWTKGTKFTYAWYLGTKKVSTKSTYTIPKKSKGKKITVKVTGSLAGYTTVTKASATKTVTK